MRTACKIALAGVVAAALAAPALAQVQWEYHGGPKAPGSLQGPSWHGPFGPYGPYGPYGAYDDTTSGGSYYGTFGPAYGYYVPGGSEPLYRCTGPATSDCYNSRALQGIR